ncbi:hypothetical protein Trydic_g11435 [Trypoxylus dichotomus]
MAAFPRIPHRRWPTTPLQERITPFFIAPKEKGKISSRIICINCTQVAVFLLVGGFGTKRSGVGERPVMNLLDGEVASVPLRYCAAKIG